MSRIELSVLGCNIAIDCRDAHARAIVMANYSLLRAQRDGPAVLRYAIDRDKSSQQFLISRDRQGSATISDDAELLYLLEKDITVEVQKLRADLYFVHGAALELADTGKALALIAPSGFGKSTTAWGMLHHGFTYLSDELVPLDLPTMLVYPYPHALCLKKYPPAGYPVPMGALHTSRTIHIPPELMPSAACSQPVTLAAIFFVEYTPEIREPAVEPVSIAEAAARIFANALNPLAHCGDGLDGAVQVAKSVPSFKFFVPSLNPTCRFIKNIFQQALLKTPLC